MCLFCEKCSSLIFARYMQIDYQLGDLIARRHDSDRRQILKSSQEAYDRFLSSVDLYGMLSFADKKLYEEYQEAPASFSMTSKKDAATRRENKIARFRQERQLKQELEVSQIILLTLPSSGLAST